MKVHEIIKRGNRYIVMCGGKEEIRILPCKTREEAERELVTLHQRIKESDAMKHKQKLAKAVQKHGDKALLHTTLGDPKAAAAKSKEARRLKKVPITLPPVMGKVKTTPSTKMPKATTLQDEAHDLETALRMIKLRWDGLAEDERKSDVSMFAIYFTAPQLEQLEKLARHWVKATQVIKAMMPSEK